MTLLIGVIVKKKSVELLKKEEKSFLLDGILTELEKNMDLKYIKLF